MKRRLLRQKKSLLLTLEEELAIEGDGPEQKVLKNYRGSGFLAVLWMIWFPPPPPPSSWCLSFTAFLCVVCWAYWPKKGVGGGATTYNSEKAWSSINHSILAGMDQIQRPTIPIVNTLYLLRFAFEHNVYWRPFPCSPHLYFSMVIYYCFIFRGKDGIPRPSVIKWNNEYSSSKFRRRNEVTRM